MTRKILSFFFALALTLTLLPVTAHAADGVRSWEDLVSAVAAGGEIKLADDITAEDDLEIPSVNFVDLDLAGHTIDLQNHHIMVSEFSFLTLADSKSNDKISEPDGKIINGFNDAPGGCVLVQEGSLFILDSGSIENCVSAQAGGAVALMNGGTFIMNGGAITGNRSVFGGGVYVGAGCSFEMNGGSITENVIEDMGDSFGGGVYVEDEGEITIHGECVIKDNLIGEETPSNLYLYDETVITINDLDTDSEIGVSVMTLPEEGEFRILTEGLNAPEGAAAFFSDDPDYQIAYEAGSGELVLLANVPVFWGKRVRLSDSIGLEFKVLLPAGFDASNTEMTFTISDGRDSGMQFSEAEEGNSYENAYWFTCPLNALELGDTVIATYTFGSNSISMKYSVMEYIEARKAKAADPEGDLLSALQNYGYYVQESGWTDKRDHAGLKPASEIDKERIDELLQNRTFQTYQIYEDLEGSGVEDVKISLALNDVTKLNVFVKTVDGQNVISDGFKKTKLNGETWWKCSISGIGPLDLDVVQDIEVDTENESCETALIKASCLSYVYAVLNSDLDMNKKLAAVAFYDYWAASEAYDAN